MIRTIFVHSKGDLCETAEILSQAWNTPMEAEELLVEVQVGIFEDRPEADFQAWKRSSGSRFHPSGESPESATQRVRMLLDRVETEHAAASLLLVTHGTLLFYLLSTVYDAIDWDSYNATHAGDRRVFPLRDGDHGAT